LDPLFQNSKLLAEFDDLLSSRDAATAKPSKEALQYRTVHALADIENKFRSLRQTELVKVEL